jgi:predicted glutamine amidotransferase
MNGALKMCNLNVVIKNKENVSMNVINLLISATTKSYVRNDDGDGIYFSNSNQIFKSKQKLNLIPFALDILKSNVVLTHQRYSTSGKTEEYTQPFNEQGFIFAHNGVISDFVSKKNKHSDSYNMFKAFLKEFNKSKIKDREKRIIKAIKKVFDELQGTYSIIIYDTETKNTYYFKEETTKINIYRTKEQDLLYLTTEEENKDLFEVYNKDFTEIDIKAYTIYCIFKNDNDKIKFKSIGSIKEPKIEITRVSTYSFSNYNDFGDFGGYSIYSDDELKENNKGAKKKRKHKKLKFPNEKEFNELENYKFNMGFRNYNDKQPCNECRELTYNYNEYQDLFLCDECINEYMEYYESLTNSELCCLEEMF